MAEQRTTAVDSTAPQRATTPSVCLLVPYFGRWPFWFNHFLESVRWNPDIHWLFFTDCGLPENAPPNASFVANTFAEYCRRVSDALAIRFAPTSPYKLCDLKPCLGAVHARELAPFDFWGFSDIDLVYGNLRRYLAPRLRYDLISTHANRISGHFCVLRNTQQMNGLFERVPHWRRLLSSQAHYAFDEGPFSRIFIRHKNWPQWARQLADKCNRQRRRAHFEEAFTTPGGRIAWRDGSHRYPAWWRWHNGELSNAFADGHDYPYFHFIQWKCECWSSQTRAEGDPAAPGGFVVSAQGIAAAGASR